MADRGFNVRDILTKKKVYLNIPPFSKKGKQCLFTKNVNTIITVIHVQSFIPRPIKINI